MTGIAYNFPRQSVICIGICDKEIPKAIVNCLSWVLKVPCIQPFSIEGQMVRQNIHIGTVPIAAKRLMIDRTWPQLFRWYRNFLKGNIKKKFVFSIISPPHQFFGNNGWINIKMPSYQYIGNPIVEIRRSYDHLISTMGFPLLVRQHLYIESGPRRFMICL